jgi:hypothetical protein
MAQSDPDPRTGLRLLAEDRASPATEVFARRGQLMLRVLTPVPGLARGFPLHPDDDRRLLTEESQVTAMAIGGPNLEWAPSLGSRSLERNA